MNKEKIVYFCCDVSGSMGTNNHKEAVKIMEEYEEKGYKVIKDVVVFTTVAKTVNIDEYKKGKNESGGTYTSSGLMKVFNEIINRFYTLSNKDITVAIIGDGDNWSEDNERVEIMVKTLKNLGIKVKFHEMVLSKIEYYTRMSERLIKKGLITSSDVEVIREPKVRIKKYSADIEVNGTLTTVRLTSDGVVKEIGVAKCNSEDKFNEALGIKIAMCRALKLNPFEKEEITDEDMRDYIDKMIMGKIEELNKLWGFN